MLGTAVRSLVQESLIQRRYSRIRMTSCSMVMPYYNQHSPKVSTVKLYKCSLIVNFSMFCSMNLKCKDVKSWNQVITLDVSLTRYLPLKNCQRETPSELTAITFICTTPKNFYFLGLCVSMVGCLFYFYFLAIEPFCLSCAFQTNLEREKKGSLSFYCFVPTTFQPLQKCPILTFV